MSRLYISDDRVSAFVASRTGLILAPGQYTQLGIMQRNQVTTGFVFTHYTGTDIAVTMAAEPGALTKTFLVRTGVYVWEELSCSRVSILTEQPRVIQLAIRLGAQIEGVKRDAFGLGRNATLLGLLKRDWKFR